MAATPALTAAHAAVQRDARLVQLKMQAQEHLIHGLGHPLDADASTLAAALVGSNIRVMKNTHASVCRSNDLRARHASTVLEMSLQSWQGMVQDRLHVTQRLLSDVPLVGSIKQPSDEVTRRTSGCVSCNAWEEIGRDQPSNFDANDLACRNMLYTGQDLLQALSTPAAVDQCTTPRCTHCQDAGRESDCQSSSSHPEYKQQQCIKLTMLQSVHAPSRIWLQSFFAELHPTQRQVGLDDVLHPWFHQQQVQRARSLTLSCAAAACTAAARTGLPASERPWVWATALGLPGYPAMNTGQECRSCHCAAAHTRQQEPTQKLQQHSCTAPAGTQDTAWWQLPRPCDQYRFNKLCQAVKQQELLVDVLISADVQNTTDNAHFFVFGDVMRAVLLAFSRDASVSCNSAVRPQPLMAIAAHEGLQQSQPLYPPSGVLPFHGLAAYLAPLCYLYSSPAALYAVWHAMYCQHWCYLHTLSSSPAPRAGLAVLCRTFQNLLQEVDLEVYQHMGALAASPLEMVFPWLMSAFAAHLAPIETLLLWDRIIGYDSLLPLPVLAAAVITFRRDLVLAAETSEELAELLEDLGRLRVVPLLQALLFDD